MARLRRAGSPSPADPLEDEDLLSEILLRLPPQPSSLPRASLVCKRWYHLVSDPGFFRRFRNHHRHSIPLIGLYFEDIHIRSLAFVPTLEPPNRVPHKRFSFKYDDGDLCRFIGCRDGLVLILNFTRLQVLVWEPVTGSQRRLAFPQVFENEESTTIHSGTVLRTAGDVHNGSNWSPFQVVLVGQDAKDTRVLACLYSSETCTWGNIMPIPLPPRDSEGFPTSIFMGIPGIRVGNSLYWSLFGSSSGILEFDMDRQSLAVIHVPVDMYAEGTYRFWVMPAEGGGLGFIFLSGFSAQLWKRKIGSDGAASWVLRKTIELNKLLAWESEDEGLIILGFAEDNNAVILWTVTGLFTVHLESLQTKKHFETSYLIGYHPFASANTAGAAIGIVHDEPELLYDT